jgi:predicted dinucleotide-binding enzyme
MSVTRAVAGRRIRFFRKALATSVAALALAAASLAAQADTPVAVREGRALRIGIIGAGNMGGPLGLAWARAGHQVLYSSRNPDRLMDLVRDAAPRASAGYPDAAAFFGDVILLAVPPSAVEQIGRDYGHLMRGKIVIDITNPRADRDGAEQTARWLEMGTGLAMAQYLPGTRLVKAFNTLSARMLANPAPSGEPIGVPVAGDDAEARNVVARLVRDAGFEPVIVGPLARAKEFDRGTPVWVTGMTARQLREALGLPPGS